MVLNLGAAFWPDADEVVIDAFTTEDDLITPSVPDTLQLDLLLQTTDLIGAQTLRPLNTINVTNDYVGADKHFTIRFRAPQRRQDLWLTATATFGVTPVQKTVQIGLSNTEQIDMNLPDNEIFTQDVLDLIPTGGPNDSIMPENNIVLAPPIQSYNAAYIFSSPQPIESFEALTYVGGGADRLLLNLQTNSYQIQDLKAPWELPAYLFMEDTQINLMTNSYFITQTNHIPQTWSVDAAGALASFTLDFDHQTSSDAKIWTVRFRQNNIYMGFNATSLLCAQAIPVTGGNDYCFSAYLRTRLMTPDTVVQNLRLRIHWFNGTSPISFTDQVLNTSDLSALTLVSVAGTAPLAATNAKVQIDMYDVDAGDDIECSLFAPQFESDLLPSTRILTSRVQDKVITPDYDAANQKMRLQFIPGFANATLPSALTLTTGPLLITIDSTAVHAALLFGPVLSAPLSFAAGDFIDLTFQHLSNGKFTIYKGGTQIAQMSLGVIPSSAMPITIWGIGIELLQLNVFSRS